MTTDKYNVEETDYSQSGWNGLLRSFMEKFDEFLHTRLLGTLGETFVAYEAGFIRKGGTTWWKAKANLSLMPCMGIAIEAGIATEEIRFQRIGPITNALWAWTAGKPVFLSQTTAGALTQVRPPHAQTQCIGFASSATTILLDICFTDTDVLATTTTTTTSTTTSSSTSTSTSSSTSTSTSTSTTTSTSSTTTTTT